MKNVWDRTQSYTRIKLCEFESLDAAYEVSFINADLLGFHIFSDQDYWDKTNKFKEIFSYLPQWIVKTLLTDLEFDLLFPILDTIQVDAIQVYNHVTREDIQQIRNKTGGQVKIIKVMSEITEENPCKDDDFIAFYDDYVDAFLLDSCWSGGSGMIGNQ